MKYTAVIFDLDGVICHTDKYHYLAWKKIADKLGIYFDETINNKLRGVSRAESFDIILKKHNSEIKDKQKYLNEKNEEYKKLLADMTENDLSEEVKNVLKSLKEKGILMAIGSSSKNAGYILKRIGLENFFDAVADGNGISNSKPDPEVFIKASKMLGTEAENCLVVEDAKAGIEAAAAAKMDSAALGDAVKSNLATYNLESINDLLKLF